MKKAILLGAAFSVAMVLGLSNFVSAAEAPNISFKSKEQGQDRENVCYFVTSYTGGTECDENIGSYDNNNNKLTLKTEINNKNGMVVVEGVNDLTVTSNGNIETSLRISGEETNLTLDFGDYSFTDKAYRVERTQGNFDTYYSDLKGNLVIKSGKIKNTMINGVASLEINGGTIEIDSENVGFPGFCISSNKNIKVSGGKIVLSNCNRAFSSDNGDINISGGEIEATNVKGAGFWLPKGNLTIDGGKINLASVKSNQDKNNGVSENNGVRVGSESEDKKIIINGGELTVDGFAWGISADKSKIYFNGGVTTVKNSLAQSVWITLAKDPENDIVFGEGMGIVEKAAYVFWDDSTSTPNTGIVDDGIVTIKKGYTYRRHYGYEENDGDTDGDSNDGSTPKVPDTGVFSGEDGGVMMIAISLGTLTAVMGGIYIVAYVAKRKKSSVKFNR